MNFLIFILAGAVAGFLADLLFKRYSFSTLVQIGLGIVGGIVGGMLFGKSEGLVDQLLTSFVGAVIVLGIATLIKYMQNRGV